MVALSVLTVVAACGQPSGSPPAGASPSNPATTATPTATPTVTAVPEPTATPTAAPTAAPTATPTPTPAPPPPFGYTCGGTFTGGSAAAGSRVVAVRAGQHEWYDRFVVEFSGTIPGWKVEPHGAHFEASPSGMPVTLEGTAGVLITIQPVDEWTSYRLPNYFYPQFTYLREARLIQNFEAVQQWGLGIRGTPCLKVTALDSPSRLVVDVYGVAS